MSFAKYISLIDTKSLFFTRIDRLKDRDEGKYPKHFFDPNFESQATPEQRSIIESNKKKMISYNKFLRKATAVNCWYLGDHESHAMWNLYLNGEEGVAIQSTYERLCNSFSSYDNEYNIYIGLIDYIDHNNDVISSINAYEPIVHKNIGFEHEKELRVAISKDVMKVVSHKPISGLSLKDLEFPPSGIKLQINLETLIETVVVSPRSQKWFKELVKSETKKHGLYDKQIIESLL